jgi:glycosyltransferase involved in cell wall biosynthesis
MGILLINHYAGSSRHGMEFRPYYLARAWIRMGHEVTIAASSESHVRTVRTEVNNWWAEEYIDGIRYVWLKTPRYSGNGPRRALNMATFVGSLFYHSGKVAGNSLPDVVIASSTYPWDIFPAFFIARLARAKLVFEVHDLWPLSPILLGGMSRRHPFIMSLQLAEDFAYKRADKVVSLLPKADSYMISRGMKPDKFSYIPNGIDMEEWNSGAEILPAVHSEKLADLRANGAFIIGYAGAHGIANALDSLLDAASLLKNSPATLVLVGQGPEKERLERKAGKRGLAKVVFLPPVARPAVPKLLDCMDVLYIGLQRQPLFRYGVSPNKLLDYMMAGKPVIHAIEAGNDLVEESRCGISIPPEDPVALADAIRKLMVTSPSERDKMGLRGRKYVEANHDYRELAKKFLEAVS